MSRFIPPQSVIAWAAASVSSNGQSATLDTYDAPFVSGFGHASAATTITLMVSHDGTNWYASSTQVLAGAADFCINATVGARFVALQSTGAATITAYLSAKGGSG